VSELLEREMEIEALRAAATEAGAGKGHAVVVQGGAGSGKTRLLQEAQSLADQAGLRVFYARATELERAFPFALVRQLFAQELAAIPPESRQATLEGATAARAALGLEPGPGEGDDPFAVLHGLYWVTAALAESRPSMLAIDDAHWADSGSLDYLSFLLPRLQELPLLLVATARADEPDSSPSLGRLLLDPFVQHLTPEPLSVEATATLLAGELERQPDSSFSTACHEVSGGNPFLLRELARDLLSQGIAPSAEQADLVRGQVPERVSRAVLTRIAKLPPEAAVLARSLAVLGDGSDLGLLAAMDGSDPEMTQRAADELRASAVFDEGSPPRFIHPLVRNAVYADMPVGERSRAHSRAAELLRSRNAGPGRVATQLLATEARGEAATTAALLEAGERALAAGAPGSSIAYLTRALREPAPVEMRTAVLDPLMTAAFRAADQAAFAEVEEDVLAEWEQNPSVRPRWSTQLMMLMALAGRFDDAARMLGEAIEVAVAEEEVERAYQMKAQLSTLAAVLPSVPEVAIADHGHRIDPDSPTGRLKAAMEVRERIANDASSREIADAARRALANNASLFAEAPDLVAADVAVMALVATDSVDDARRAAERAEVIAKERGATPDLARAFFLRGFVAWGAGDLVTAEADMRQGIDLARLAGILPLVVLYTSMLIEVLVERDELDVAEAELQAIGMAEGPVFVQSLATTLLLTRGHLRLERGDFASAAEHFAVLSTEEVIQRFGHGPAGSACPYAARALIALGKEQQARELADGEMARALRWGSPSGISHCARGVAATRDSYEKIKLLESAAAMLVDSPRRLERAHALVDLGEALRRSGRRADARGPLREAFDLARRCGAARIARRANAELEATGEKVRRYAPIGVESLTPSERRVADMAASGMTNRQIAQSLFVTVKTVEAHLSATYDKLDIGSRRELPHALGDEGPGSN
jgi:DNA-binding CsgD family transcriptional regulator/tetratricopeptide (TPR) repeat protein